MSHTITRRTSSPTPCNHNHHYFSSYIIIELLAAILWNNTISLTRICARNRNICKGSTVIPLNYIWSQILLPFCLLTLNPKAFWFLEFHWIASFYFEICWCPRTDIVATNSSVKALNEIRLLAKKRWLFQRYETYFCISFLCWRSMPILTFCKFLICKEQILHYCNSFFTAF